MNGTAPLQPYKGNKLETPQETNREGQRRAKGDQILHQIWTMLQNLSVSLTLDGVGSEARGKSNLGLVNYFYFL